MFDPTGAYRLSPRVGLRPEPFGALAYHFDTRRLVFLKSTDLVDLVESLGSHPSADEGRGARDRCAHAASTTPDSSRDARAASKERRRSGA